MDAVLHLASIVLASLAPSPALAPSPLRGHSRRGFPEWAAAGAILLCAWLLTRVSVAEVLQVFGAIAVGCILYVIVVIRR